MRKVTRCLVRVRPMVCSKVLYDPGSVNPHRACPGNRGPNTGGSRIRAYTLRRDSFCRRPILESDNEQPGEPADPPRRARRRRRRRRGGRHFSAGNESAPDGPPSNGPEGDSFRRPQRALGGAWSERGRALARFPERSLRRAAAPAAPPQARGHWNPNGGGGEFQSREPRPAEPAGFGEAEPPQRGRLAQRGRLGRGPAALGRRARRRQRAPALRRRGQRRGSSRRRGGEVLRAGRGSGGRGACSRSPAAPAPAPPRWWRRRAGPRRAPATDARPAAARVRPAPLPPRTGRGHPRGARRPRHAGRHADRRRQVTHLPAPEPACCPGSPSSSRR